MTTEHHEDDPEVRLVRAGELTREEVRAFAAPFPELPIPR